MGEEAFDEIVIVSEDGKKEVSLCGGYGRDHLYLGIGDVGDGLPMINAKLGPAEIKELRRAIREMRVRGVK